MVNQDQMIGRLSKNSFPNKSKNFNFARQNYKNQNLHSIGPKLENFIPLENGFKVLKVSRRHLPKILTEDIQI